MNALTRRSEILRLLESVVRFFRLKQYEADGRDQCSSVFCEYRVDMKQAIEEVVLFRQVDFQTSDAVGEEIINAVIDLIASKHSPGNKELE